MVQRDPELCTPLAGTAHNHLAIRVGGETLKHQRDAIRGTKRTVTNDEVRTINLFLPFHPITASKSERVLTEPCGYRHVVYFHTAAQIT